MSLELRCSYSLMGPHLGLGLGQVGEWVVRVGDHAQSRDMGPLKGDAPKGREGHPSKDLLQV